MSHDDAGLQNAARAELAGIQRARKLLGMIPLPAAVWVLLGAALVLCPGPPAWAADGTDVPSDATQIGGDSDESDDDDDLGDDGSSRLGREGLIRSDDLRPIGRVEEEALLGDWGDSASEAED